MRNLGHIGFINNYVRHSDDLLLRGLEISGLLGFGPQRLNCIHYILRLVDKGLAQLSCPIQVCIHLGNHLGELGDLLHIVIPRLVIHLGNVIRVLYKSRRLNDFQGISRRREDNCDQRIRVQCYGLDELLKLCRAPLGWSRGRWRRRGIGGCRRCVSGVSRQQLLSKAEAGEA
jgi:hypothetical protein